RGRRRRLGRHRQSGQGRESSGGFQNGASGFRQGNLRSGFGRVDVFGSTLRAQAAPTGSHSSARSRKSFGHNRNLMPVGTAFHEKTFALCESLNYREWAGYYTVSAYETHHEHEYNAIRNASALIDITPLYKYRITGRDATRLVDRVV